MIFKGFLECSNKVEVVPRDEQIINIGQDDSSDGGIVKYEDGVIRFTLGETEAL